MGDASSKRKHVAIVGAGFGGLNAAKTLARQREVNVTLIDRHNYHLFQPLLYQVAMAGLNPGDIAVPIRSILTDAKNVRVLMGEVQSVDLKEQRVLCDFATLTYDYLILACGANHSYFGNDQWENYAPGLKTLEQATEVRRRVLLAFETAERETNTERIKQLLTFVVVGGGPTGVELAGALGEISRYFLDRDFRHIDPTRTRVILIEAGSRVLAAFDESLSLRAARDLERLGVTVWTSTRVTGITSEGVELGSEMLKASTVIWAAGVKPAKMNSQLGVELDRAGRVVVKRDLSLSAFPNVFVLGDQAHCEDKDGTALPGLAPVAIQQGRFCAKNILRDLKGKPRDEFNYVDKGQMATIGVRRAVVQMKHLKFAGVVAWFAWLVIHIYFLVGFKNRLAVIFQWAWAYLTFKRGAQLIVNKEWREFADQTKSSS